MASPSSSYLVCNACGTQHATANRTALTTCFICDDPRQYTPPSGQSFTTLSTLRDAGGHHNEFHPYPPSPSSSSASTFIESAGHQPLFTSIRTAPQFAIGQRAMLIATPAGNVLWDCVAYLDEATVGKVQDMGGIKAMVISHPHFYSTHLEWAERFGCPVYLAAEDKGWLARRSEARQVFLVETETRIVVDGVDTGVRVIKLGGHFPGSCRWTRSYCCL